jgi:hypothetical protein
LTSEIPYEKGRGFRYLDAVGGADAKGWKKKVHYFTPMVRRMWRVHSCFLRTIQRLPGSHYCSGKPEDEYGEFVSMGFGQFSRCYCDIEVIKSKW